MNRERMLNELSDAEAVWDVLVIGGGATGLGTALDAASRGYRTALLESVDFAKGTSSRSTKLIHGGVRYLRSGQVRMVRESLIERRRLQSNAPHLVHPMQFIVPAYRWGMRWYFYAGMKLYDLLAGTFFSRGNGFSRSQLLSRERASDLLPTLQTERPPKQRLRGGVLYSDGQFDDARLAISLAQTLVAQGGVALNYAPVTGLLNKNGKTCGAKFRDIETGAELNVNAKVVINATGVFGESVMALDQDANTVAPPRIVPSQGTHVVLDRRFLPTDYAIMIPETDDGRVLFAIPWHGRTLLGTTDHEVDEILEEPKPLQQEIDYLLEHAGRYLTKQPTPADVLSTYSGLRPLVGKGAKGQSTASLSREHEIYTSSSGLITVIGGKWTTYRKMGEDVVDLAIPVAGLPKEASKTANLKLAGAPETSQQGASDRSPADPLAVFGSSVAGINALIAKQPELGEPLHSDLPYLLAHVIWSARHEMARTVDDILARRTRALLLNARAASESAEIVAELLCHELQFTESWRDAQVRSFQDLASGYMR